MEEKIKDAIGQIRPFLQRDGGDIEFVELTEDNVVKVKLQGHCAGCPGAQMTIKGVVERIIKESYPQKMCIRDRYRRALYFLVAMPYSTTFCRET